MEPTKHENDAAQERIRRLDEISPKCAWHKHLCECSEHERKARERYNAIMAVQQAYEERYC